jgi:uncharacterized protein YbaP (TraB family)
MAGLLLTCATPAVPTVAWAAPPVWVVSDKDSEVVLFGSVHVLPPNLAWRPPALEAALKNADDLWFELPMDMASQAMVAQMAQTKGVLPPSQSLFAILSPKDAAKLKTIAATYALNPALLDHLQPWMAEVALSGAVFAKAGAGTADGVELSVQTEAPRTAQRRAFETPAQQIDMLAAAPMDEQVASLRQTMDEMADGPDEFARLLRAWMAGDVRALEKEEIDPLRKASPALFQRLVTDRNIRWTQVLDERLKGHGRTVVVVGMGHLVGKDGLPARLKALGYTVKGP